MHWRFAHVENTIIIGIITALVITQVWYSSSNIYFWFSIIVLGVIFMYQRQKVLMMQTTEFYDNRNDSFQEPPRLLISEYRKLASLSDRVYNIISPKFNYLISSVRGDSVAPEAEEDPPRDADGIPMDPTDISDEQKIRDYIRNTNSNRALSGQIVEEFIKLNFALHHLKGCDIDLYENIVKQTLR